MNNLDKPRDIILVGGREAHRIVDLRALEAAATVVSWTETPLVPQDPSSPKTLLVQADAAALEERVIVDVMRKYGLRFDKAVTQECLEFYCRVAEGWRPISPKRARKLRRRGEHVRYLGEFGSNAWQPPHLRTEH